MRILAFSDLHRNTSVAQAIVTASIAADVVVGAGDFSNFGRGLVETLAVLAPLKVPFVLVAGNHEFVEDLRACAAPYPNWHVLHGDTVELGGVTFFGFGYAVEPFATGRVPTILSDEVAEPALARLPAGAIFVTHAPAFGTADIDTDGSHRGSHAIRKVIADRQPRLHVCGHIHHAWGTTGTIGSTPSHNLGPRANWFEV